MANKPVSFFQDISDFLHNLIFEETRVWYDRNPGFGEIFLGLTRLLLVFLMLLAFELFGGETFQTVHSYNTAVQVRQISPLLHLIPVGLISFLIFVFTWENLRYTFPVIGALVSVLIAGAFYVKDIYNLKQVTSSLKYVTSSMFAINYPHVDIDNGEKKIARKEVNLLDEIGGPGYATIQPGNAVLFHKLRKVSRNIITQSVLMTRFERIGEITNLDDQDGYVEEMQTVTRDGIQIKVRDIRYRYRILSETINGQPVPRTKENPYPFSQQAFINLSYYLSVNENSQMSWGQAVKMMVTGVIDDYINSHVIDSLTAPREHQQDPRREIAELMFGPGLTNSLRMAGTQLQWVDIGHFDIIAGDIDQERINLWAAEWVGDAGIKKAASEAQRLAYMELGRAEGQAEMLIGISQALSAIELDPNRAHNIRHLLLARTSQILDSMHDNGREENPPTSNQLSR
jgi:hypothetical protein